MKSVLQGLVELPVAGRLLAQLEPARAQRTLVCPVVVACLSHPVAVARCFGFALANHVLLPVCIVLCLLVELPRLHLRSPSAYAHSPASLLCSPVVLSGAHSGSCATSTRRPFALASSTTLASSLLSCLAPLPLVGPCCTSWPLHRPRAQCYLPLEPHWLIRSVCLCGACSPIAAQALAFFASAVLHEVRVFSSFHELSTFRCPRSHWIVASSAACCYCLMRDQGLMLSRFVSDCHLVLSGADQRAVPPNPPVGLLRNDGSGSRHALFVTPLLGFRHRFLPLWLVACLCLSCSLSQLLQESSPANSCPVLPVAASFACVSLLLCPPGAADCADALVRQDAQAARLVRLAFLRCVFHCRSLAVPG